MAQKPLEKVLDGLADGAYSGHRFLCCAEFTKEFPSDACLPPATTPLKSTPYGYECHKHRQAHDGHWRGEYGGPTFLISGLTTQPYITHTPFTNKE